MGKTLKWFICCNAITAASALSTIALNAVDQYLSFVNVEYVTITPVEASSTHASQHWQVDISVQNQTYCLELNEISRFYNGVISGQLTQGNAFVLTNNKLIKCGTARIVIDVFSPTNFRAQGTFEVGTEALHLDSSPSYQIWRERNVFKRSEDRYSTIDSDFGKKSVNDEWPAYQLLRGALGNNSENHCFESKKMARIGVTADSSFLSNFPSLSDAQLHIADTINKASQFWEEAFNITISLTEVVTAHNKRDEYPWDIACDENSNSILALESRLKALTSWRKTQRSNDSLALWLLMTSCPSGDVVGLSWQGTLCKTDGASIVKHSNLDYRVLAHEIGHVFGAVHDCTNQTCGSSTVCCPLTQHTCDARGAFIMNPGTTTDQFKFSNCTRSNICSGIVNGYVTTSCLERTRGGSLPIQLESNQCTSILDPLMRYQCLKNIQCKNYMDSETTYYCGKLEECTLSCYNSYNDTCTNVGFPMLDGTPCRQQLTGVNGSIGLCIKGKCKHSSNRRSLWCWVAAGIGIGAGAFLSIALLKLIASSLGSCIQRNKPGANKALENLEIGSPRPVSRSKLTKTAALPPILQYASPYESPQFQTPSRSFSFINSQTAENLEPDRVEQ